MSQSSLERVKSRIRKLLNVAANDASTEGEINNAIHMARQMMHVHNLDEADVEREVDVDMTSREAVSLSSKWTVWETDLATVVAEFIGGVGVYLTDTVSDRRNALGSVTLRKGRIVRGKQLVFYGEAESVSLAVGLHLELSDTIATMAGLRFGGWSRGAGREYAEGFVVGLHHQIQAADAEAAEDATGRALVARSTALMEAKLVAARQWLQSEGVQTCRKRIGGKGRCDHDEAFYRGVKDGKSQSMTNERSTKLASPSQGMLADA